MPLDPSIYQQLNTHPLQDTTTKLSGLLSLQGQQSQNKTLEAQSQLEQMAAAKQAGLQNFFKSFDPSQHMAEDGTTDLQSISADPLYKASPYKDEIQKTLLGIKSQQLENKGKLANLNGTVLQQFGTAAGALAGDPDVKADAVDPATGMNTGRVKLKGWLDNFAQLSPDAARIAKIWTPMIEHVPQGKLADAVRSLQLQAQDVAGQQSVQLPKTGSIDAGPNILLTNTNPITGDVTETGAIKKGLAPTQTPDYIRSTAAAGAEGGAGATNDEQYYNNIVTGASKATQIKSLTSDIQKMASEVQTGQYSKAFAGKWAALAQSLGLNPGNMDSATKRQLLSKMAAQLRIQAEAGASTDSERAGIESAMPNPEEMTPEAIQKAARYVGAQSDVSLARAELANKHRSVHGGKSTGLREADSAFMQHADPRIFEYQSIPAGEARKQYLREHFSSRAEAEAFENSIEQLKKYEALK